MSGKAKGLLGALPIDDIATVEGADSGSKLKPDLLPVGLRSGGSLTFEVVKADGCDEIVKAFAGLQRQLTSIGRPPDHFAPRLDGEALQPNEASETRRGSSACQSSNPSRNGQRASERHEDR
jgi:hypothetical protein